MNKSLTVKSCTDSGHAFISAIRKAFFHTAFLLITNIFQYSAITFSYPPAQRQDCKLFPKDARQGLENNLHTRHKKFLWQV